MNEREKPLVFIDREGKPGGGKGLLISKDLSFTLSGLRQNLLLWECGDESFDDGECGISDSFVGCLADTSEP